LDVENAEKTSSNPPSVTLPGAVKKVIRRPYTDDPEKAEVV